MTRVTVVAVLLLACGAPARPAARGNRPSVGPSAESASLRVRAAPSSDAAVDATFDQEARGGRPVWAATPAIMGGVRITLRSLAPEARRCFSGHLEATIGVSWTVAPDGRASDIVVETKHPRARACLAAAIAAAVFPVSHRAWRVDYVFSP